MFRDAHRLIQSALPERRGRLVALLLLAAGAALAEGAALLLLERIVNQLPITAPRGRLELAMLAYLTIAAAAAALGWAQSRWITHLRLEAADRLRREALEAVLQSEWPALRRMPGAATTQIITVEASRAGAGIDFLVSGAGIALRLPVLAAVAFSLAPALAAIVAGASAILAFATSRADRQARRTGERMVDAGRVLQASVTETLAGRRLVKVFGLERERLDAFVGAIDRARGAQLAQQRVFATSNAANAFVAPAAIAVTLWVAVRMMGMAMGSALVFAFAFARLAQSVLALRSARRIVIGALPAHAAVRSLIAEARAGAEPPAHDIAFPSSRIVLDAVSLTYEDGTRALAGVSAVIPIGAVTAIAGPSGAGKSSLLDIVMGLAPPTSGRVLLDDRPLDDGARRAWRAQIGYVAQEVFLFDVSIRANLLAARAGATEAELWDALEDAGAAAAVRALPAGLDTIAGERGARLSGGEAQRIAIARALLRRPALLVLDEPTSALDAEAEARIIATLRHLKGRHTIVLAAHRASLAAIADHTITLRAGRTV